MIDDIRAKIHIITDAIYEEFVPPNPYMRPQRPARTEFSSVVDALGRPALSDLPSFYTPKVAEVGCQIPPIGAPAPVAPLQSPIQPIRCASNAVSSGIRCARCAFLPHTL